MTTKVAGVGGLSETKKYSLTTLRKCVFVNLCAISVVFTIAWKRAVFGWNYTGAVYGQSYNGPYRIRIVSSTKAFQKAPIPSFVIEQRMLGVLPSKKTLTFRRRPRGHTTSATLSRQHNRNFLGHPCIERIFLDHPHLCRPLRVFVLISNLITESSYL